MVLGDVKYLNNNSLHSSHGSADCLILRLLSEADERILFANPCITLAHQSAASEAFFDGRLWTLSCTNRADASVSTAGLARLPSGEL